MFESKAHLINFTFFSDPFLDEKSTCYWCTCANVSLSIVLLSFVPIALYSNIIRPVLTINTMILLSIPLNSVPKAWYNKFYVIVLKSYSFLLIVIEPATFKTYFWKSSWLKISILVIRFLTIYVQRKHCVCAILKKRIWLFFVIFSISNLQTKKSKILSILIDLGVIFTKSCEYWKSVLRNLPGPLACNCISRDRNISKYCVLNRLVI